MQIVELQAFRDDMERVIASAQTEEVLICDRGTAVVVLSKPKSPFDFERYWQEREAKLAEIQALPGWDSTIAVSEDRDRA
jgi:hypothetical protein